MFKRLVSFFILFIFSFQGALASSGDLQEDMTGSLLDGEVIISDGSGPLDIKVLTGVLDLSGIIDSGTGILEDLETSSGSLIEIKSGEAQTGGVLEISSGSLEINPYENRFKILFQSPTYLLEKDLEKDSYLCDENEEECKVNLNIDDLELKTFSSKFYCNHDFSFTTGEEEKCNPNTIIFGTGVSDIYFRIYNKEDNNLIWEKKLTIINGLEKEYESETGSLISTGTIEANSGCIEAGTGIINVGTGEINSSSGSIIGAGFMETETGIIEIGTGFITNSGEIIIPDAIIEIQSGLEFLTGTTWKCKKEDCKINLTGVSSFTGGFEEKDFDCLWSFSGGVYNTGTLEKCNPGYVDYGSGVFDINFKIIDKNDETNFKESFISIENKQIQDFEVINITSGGGSSISFKKLKEIVVQSGLIKQNGEYICEDKQCKINFVYQNTYKQNCIWDFGGATYRDKFINTCNPGYIYFEGENNKVKLEVYDNGSLVDKKEISYTNKYLVEQKKKNKAPVSKITLQGKDSKYKEIEKNKVKCLGVEECSINFTGTDSYDVNGDSLEYHWDLGNGEFYDGLNPKSIKYKPGKYKIILEVKDIFGAVGEDIFYVEVYKDKLGKIIIDENVFSDLKISGVLVNNTGVDDFEWVELQNIGDKKLNLKGLYIDDTIGKGSKAYRIENDFILLPYTKNRFYKSKTNLSLGNITDEVNIIYDEKIVDNLSWDFKVPDDFVLNHENIDLPFQKVYVERVVDGDTIDIKFENGKVERLRLIGVDTPETKHPRKPIEEFGIEAYEFTKSILEGQYVYLETGIDDRGKYGRLLGYIYIGELDNLLSFNELLIKKGYARAYLKYPFKYSKEYDALGKEAKKQKVGMWANKELVREMEFWEDEEDLFLEELEKENLYNFDDIFLNGVNINELKKKKKEYVDLIDSEIKGLKKDFSLEPDFLVNWQKGGIKKELSIDDSIKTIEKKLKASISYRIYKQKKGLKITGNSKEYREVFMLFDGKKINLKTDNNGDFIYYTTNFNSGNYILDFFGVDKDVGEIYLKSSKIVNLTEEYKREIVLKNIKKSSSNESTANDIKKDFRLSIIKQVKANDLEEKKSVKIILNLFLTILCLLFGFLTFRKKYRK